MPAELNNAYMYASSIWRIILYNMDFQLTTAHHYITLQTEKWECYVKFIKNTLKNPDTLS